jgi:long-subunit acyl-CoA synthetase (AMP-forming)
VLSTADDVERRAVEAAMGRVRDGGGPRDGDWQRAARARVGLDDVTVAIVGAAPCAEELLVFWHALGIPLSELYGMSETTGVATVAAPDAIRIGTVGPALPVCDVRIGEGGEVLMRGPVIMRGYRNQPERTAEVIDADGWLHSGDIGELDDDGHLRIVDRIKELIITSAGKNLSPANIEATLKSRACLIGQVCVVGDGRPYNVALLTLEPEAAGRFAADIGVSGSLARLARSRHVLDAVRAEVAAGNARLARVEQVKRVMVLDREWLPDGDELTPTMKLRRRQIAAKYAQEIDAVYDGTAGMEVASPVWSAR